MATLDQSLSESETIDTEYSTDGDDAHLPITPIDTRPKPEMLRSPPPLQMGRPANGVGITTTNTNVRRKLDFNPIKTKSKGKKASASGAGASAASSNNAILRPSTLAAPTWADMDEEDQQLKRAADTINQIYSTKRAKSDRHADSCATLDNILAQSAIDVRKDRLAADKAAELKSNKKEMKKAANDRYHNERGFISGMALAALIAFTLIATGMFVKSLDTVDHASLFCNDHPTFNSNSTAMPANFTTTDIHDHMDVMYKYLDASLEKQYRLSDHYFNVILGFTVGILIFAVITFFLSCFMTSTGATCDNVTWSEECTRKAVSDATIKLSNVITASENRAIEALRRNESAVATHIDDFENRIKDYMGNQHCGMDATRRDIQNLTADMTVSTALMADQATKTNSILDCTQNMITNVLSYVAHMEATNAKLDTNANAMSDASSTMNKQLNYLEDLRDHINANTIKSDATLTALANDIEERITMMKKVNREHEIKKERRLEKEALMKSNACIHDECMTKREYNAFPPHLQPQPQPPSSAPVPAPEPVPTLRRATPLRYGEPRIDIPANGDPITIRETPINATPIRNLTRDLTHAVHTAHADQQAAYHQLSTRMDAIASTVDALPRVSEMEDMIKPVAKFMELIADTQKADYATLRADVNNTHCNTSKCIGLVSSVHADLIAIKELPSRELKDFTIVLKALVDGITNLEDKVIPPREPTPSELLRSNRPYNAFNSTAPPPPSLDAVSSVILDNTNNNVRNLQTQVQLVLNNVRAIRTGRETAGPASTAESDAPSPGMETTAHMVVMDSLQRIFAAINENDDAARGRDRNTNNILESVFASQASMMATMVSFENIIEDLQRSVLVMTNNQADAIIDIDDHRENTCRDGTTVNEGVLYDELLTIKAQISALGRIFTEGSKGDRCFIDRMKNVCTEFGNLEDNIVMRIQDSYQVHRNSAPIGESPALHRKLDILTTNLDSFTNMFTYPSPTTKQVLFEIVKKTHVNTGAIHNMLTVLLERGSHDYSMPPSDSDADMPNATASFVDLNRRLSFIANSNANFHAKFDVLMDRFVTKDANDRNIFDIIRDTPAQLRCIKDSILPDIREDISEIASDMATAAAGTGTCDRMFADQHERMAKLEDTLKDFIILFTKKDHNDRDVISYIKRTSDDVYGTSLRYQTLREDIRSLSETLGTMVPSKKTTTTLEAIHRDIISLATGIPSNLQTCLSQIASDGQHGLDISGAILAYINANFDKMLDRQMSTVENTRAAAQQGKKIIEYTDKIACTLGNMGPLIETTRALADKTASTTTATYTDLKASHHLIETTYSLADRINAMTTGMNENIRSVNRAIEEGGEEVGESFSHLNKEVNELIMFAKHDLSMIVHQNNLIIETTKAKSKSAPIPPNPLIEKDNTDSFAAIDSNLKTFLSSVYTDEARKIDPLSGIRVGDVEPRPRRTSGQSSTSDDGFVRPEIEASGSDDDDYDGMPGLADIPSRPGPDFDANANAQA
jgi:hypothetical protein